MTDVAMVKSRTTMGRAWWAVIGLMALAGAGYTYVLMALHVYSLQANPGSGLQMVGLGQDEAGGLLRPGLRYDFATVTVGLDVVVYESDQPFLGWQIGAWVSRYALAILLLLSVVYLSWRRWRSRPGLGRAMSWWAGGLGLFAMTVAIVAPWALVHADQLVARAVAAPTVWDGDDPWFVVPAWSWQDTDWSLMLAAALLLVLAVLLRRGHQAEGGTEASR